MWLWLYSPRVVSRVEIPCSTDLHWTILPLHIIDDRSFSHSLRVLSNCRTRWSCWVLMNCDLQFLLFHRSILTDTTIALSSSSMCPRELWFLLFSRTTPIVRFCYSWLIPLLFRSPCRCVLVNCYPNLVLLIDCYDIALVLCYCSPISTRELCPALLICRLCRLFIEIVESANTHVSHFSCAQFSRAVYRH